MDPILLTVIFKGSGMVLAILGGIWVVRYGFHLYKDGVGSTRDDAAFEVGPVKMKAKSVGSVVMATAFLWVWAGVVLSPNLDKTGNDIKVYSFDAPNINIKTASLETEIPRGLSSVEKNPEELKKLLEKAIKNAKNWKTAKKLEINGAPAQYDFNAIKVLENKAGGYYVATAIRSENNQALLAFEPEVHKGKVVFLPSKVDKLENDESKPNKSLKDGDALKRAP